MNIYLFLDDKILNYHLPEMVSGSFAFGENDKRIINIEGVNNKWFLYSTSDYQVLTANGIANELEILKDNYYIIQDKNKRYLIYVSDLFDNSFNIYKYNNNFDLTIGNTNDCNLKFDIPYVVGKALRIYKENNLLVVNTFECNVYVNNNILVKKSSNKINFGTTINLYGLKVIISKNYILINNPLNRVKIDFKTNDIIKLQKPTPAEYYDREISDIELYGEENYFSKSPRIRRIIKTKEIELSQPPKNNESDKMPIILTIGPMITMALGSSFMLYNSFSKFSKGEANLSEFLPSLIFSFSMILGMILWPLLSRRFTSKISKRKKKQAIEKYTEYLEGKKQELKKEYDIQKQILIENLISTDKCIDIIQKGNINLWAKRNDQNDFLDVRIGYGKYPLDVKINFPKEGFTIEEDELRKKAEELVQEFKYINDVPIKYSLFENNITSIIDMSNENKKYSFIKNIILQLVTFYSYEDIKLVIFTNDENNHNWEYLKYLNHNMSALKDIRFYSSNFENSKRIFQYLSYELQQRMQNLNDEKIQNFTPYYIIITDDYSQIKRNNFIKIITEAEINLGFSFIILENKLGKLPSKCNDFIILGTDKSEILINSFDAQEETIFKEEVYNDSIPENVLQKISNIPIELDYSGINLPDTITFLEMEKVSKVEQLNIHNRWNQSDPINSLKSEVGVDSDGNLVYLDLHEKFHGPHGLIAGMTGSGKSEFIITYILSMCINYSPDYVSFILIDYKGGGLAGAFENKVTGIRLPHLSGTITNLDKAEMDRTLVSINSEIKTRQSKFNEARDMLNESTMDIYKYQQFYKDGKLKDAIPHLFIICDEFAELKSQQPDFMSDLISVARIGRSLGVHLILATQKPSGVVNDQIWSNSKFRVCLKVQDALDSNEMLKRPDAAALKQTGRFYLQVGYDEFFLLGQSAWCGAKYYPSDKIIKQVDKSLDFIDETGSIIKSIQAGSKTRVSAQGDQITSILKNIIDISKTLGKKAKMLWLSNIDPIILVDNLKIKYNFEPKKYNVEAIIGEYDAPEIQEQGLSMYSLKNNSNTLVYGNNEMERENLLNVILYSICENYTPDEINIYIIDYGSEQLRIFNNFPQIGGVVYEGESDKFDNLIKMIFEELNNRKKMLSSYGGSLEIYNSKNEKKLSQILFIINNYDSLLESYNYFYEDVASLSHECERYGISIIITCLSPSSISRRVAQSFNNVYCYSLNDSSDYFSAFGIRPKVKLRSTFGRGLMYNGEVHEFQTASIVDTEEEKNNKILSLLDNILEKTNTYANIT